MAILAGKLAARREACAPVAGKSTLNRLELSKPQPAYSTASWARIERTRCRGKEVGR
jgi:hypothetical protein